MENEFELYKKLIDDLSITEEHLSFLALKYPRKWFKRLVLGALTTSLVVRVCLLTFSPKGCM